MMSSAIIPHLLMLLLTWMWTSQAWPIRTQQPDALSLLAKSYSNVKSYDPRDNQSQREKRLMGIFRCNGWGPGCLQFNDLSKASSGGGHMPTYEKHTSPSRAGGSYYSRGGSHRAPPFEPFFALTSGGSWGPTGKRSSPFNADGLDSGATWPQAAPQYDEPLSDMEWIRSILAPQRSAQKKRASNQRL